MKRVGTVFLECMHQLRTRWAFDLTVFLTDVLLVGHKA